MLDRYQERYRLYDWVLGELAQLLSAKYPGAAAIDIGANVGDTAALLCSRQPIAVLCIEGHPRFLPYLRRNVRQLPGEIAIAECLIGAGPGRVPLAGFTDHHGTASIDHAVAAAGQNADGVPVRPLAELLAEHSRFRHARLVKTDTDGSDFEILGASAHLFAETRPVLFFEYDPTLRARGIEEARATVAALLRAGYCRFLVYDNFGHFLRRIDGDCAEQFAELDRYLFSNLFYGRQIYYYDVCAFSLEGADVCEALESAQRLVVEAAMHRDGREIRPEKQRREARCPDFPLCA